MRARPLGMYAAVEPIESKTFEGTNILMTAKTRHSRWLKGRVLAVGSGVGEEVSVGDEVLYEAQSAHPGQSAPIAAELFGGTDGKNCYLIPVMKQSLRSASSLDKEVAIREREMKRLSDLGDTRFLNDAEASQYGRHEKRVSELKEERRELARGSKWDPWKTPGRGAGIVGIVQESEDGEK